MPGADGLEALLGEEYARVLADREAERLARQERRRQRLAEEHERTRARMLEQSRARAGRLAPCRSASCTCRAVDTDPAAPHGYAGQTAHGDALTIRCKCREEFVARDPATAAGRFVVHLARTRYAAVRATTDAGNAIRGIVLALGWSVAWWFVFVLVPLWWVSR